MCKTIYPLEKKQYNSGMLRILVVGIGGFFGAIARYWLSGIVQVKYAGRFPYGTLVVNVVGCLFIGFLLTLVTQRQLFSPNIRLLLVTGFLGALTTFSTFSYETVTLLGDNQIWSASLNLILNLLLGVGAVLLGRLLARAI